jgi:hypothetical protein
MTRFCENCVALFSHLTKHCLSKAGFLAYNVKDIIFVLPRPIANKISTLSFDVQKAKFWKRRAQDFPILTTETSMPLKSGWNK